MAHWRRKANDAFPQLARELRDPRFTIHLLFGELSALAETAVESNDDDLARRVFGFAAWCFGQTTGELSNAAGVSFYENLFNRWELRRDMLPWLPPDVREACWPLWEHRLDHAQINELQRLLSAPSAERWREYAG